MLCSNRDIGIKVLSSCDRCRKYEEGAILRLSELIPSGHCFELLHSLLPYIVTFQHGGWFPWERAKDRVVICCPSMESNVCVELRKIAEKGKCRFQYRILEIHGSCKFYEPGKVFEIGKDFDRLCWELFNLVFPYVRAGVNRAEVSCGASKSKSRFELSLIEER